MGHKPDSVTSLSEAAIICLCGQNPEFKRCEQQLIPYLALLRDGLAFSVKFPFQNAGSYPAVSPLPDRNQAVYFLLRFPFRRI